MSKQQLPQVRAIMGVESLLVQEAVAELRAKVPYGDASLNCEEVDLGSGQISTLIDAAHTLPMMARMRWVHGRNLHKLPAKEHPALIDYLAQPSATTVLVLSGERPDGRLRLIQQFRRAGVLEVHEAPKSANLNSWATHRAARQGLHLDSFAAEQLVHRVAEGLGPLARAIDVLALYAGSEGTVSVETIEELVAPSHEASVFELTGAVGKKDWGKAATCLSRLLAGGEEPLGILAMVVRQLRLLHAAKHYDGSPQQIAQALGVPPFVAHKLTQEARQFTSAALIGHLHACERADAQLKGGSLAGRWVMSRLVADICSP